MVAWLRGCIMAVLHVCMVAWLHNGSIACLQEKPAGRAGLQQLRDCMITRLHGCVMSV